ncbi:MAG: hypothetical protein C0598_06350, partial [Marinilabiliales bacterium]
SLTRDNIMLTVNSVPKLELEDQIPLGLRVGSDGNYEISLISAKGFESIEKVYLQDHLLDKTHNLSSGSYSFYTEAGDITNRFVINCSTLGIDDNTIKDQDVYVFAYNQRLTIINETNLRGKTKVLNIFGQEVYSFKLYGNSNQSYTLNVPTGIYIVYTVLENGKAVTTKVLIK